MRLYTDIVINNKVYIELDNLVSYVLNEFQDDFAAERIIDDYFDTLERLKIIGDGYKLMDNPRLREKGYRRIKFKRYKHLVLVYWCDEENLTIYIEGLYDSRTDYYKRIT